ncbi:phytoene desaturase family protein [Roseiconus lacunae]|uniref:NAD(P)/FAD-dependent oxidoreductase n=1 Tax=Roseiconus lacunae TaxID=2605694 RepID=A0ABT7PMV4_9BACT|nr:NAD(P)/FAD-dependent oxidoreductase [Roseiconus lacunae]MCD0461543.1 NAD(P)/FAD-dependent oxidoreductase [Roseiconus lacunae]MDM4017621.1 NAD(P)/FAD-dependent oxidoreductase [Roseiconus lacunae]WRQ51116.1 NAD(P)/FAD-dependent oxidoreductase [Stieleria sp. HD01]
MIESAGNQHYDTIIIGAGMSGLAAGIRLAHYDQRVCILERHYTIGGLNSFYRMGGRDYDVGLHAMTNFARKGSKKGPLAKLIRQLRFSWEDFKLAEQVGSSIRFPGVSLDFSNDAELLENEVAERFPTQIDGYRSLCQSLLDYSDMDGGDERFMRSARDVMGEHLSDPLLIEMLLCPLMWYGNAREDDMDFGQFCIMFRACYLEGFGRPFKGVRVILKNLVRKFRGLGGELKLRSGVSKIHVENGRAVGVVLDNGTELTANRILSSAGNVETMRLCDDITEVEVAKAGKLSFIESISILDRMPKSFGFDRTIVFYNDSDTFHWKRPDDALCDARTGVICSPNNYIYEPDEGELPDGVIRITTLANHDQWCALPEDHYAAEKVRQYDAAVNSSVRFMPDFRQYVVDTDVFTPKTIRRFTWHDNGAVYGAPDKQLDGTTHLPNVFLCGTDQGFVGIVGAIVSGISMANRHCLMP